MEYDSIRNNTDKSLYYPGLVIAGLRGGSGKTIFSVGLIAAIKRLAISIAPFKKGPDYIDAGWLALAAGRSCHNLDTFLIEPKDVLLSYKKYSSSENLSIVEGNRGLYDCINTKGETSTAALAKLLNLPIILSVDVTKTTRTMAAIILGLLNFDPNVQISGIILNRIAGLRHEKILTQSIEKYCGVPIIGAVPKLTRESFPERHMGLVPTTEHEWARTSIDFIRNITNKYLDINTIINISGYEKSSFKNKKQNLKKIVYYRRNKKINYQLIKNKPVIGVMKDSAFQFYYPENFEALENEGANIVFISPIKSNKIPNIDALYIGGGFPETHAKELEKNTYIRKNVNLLAQNGLPIYAECGGLIYLGKELIINNKNFAMSGVLPASFKISKRPKGHGYTIIKVEKKNPFYPIGFELLGHEFHYSSIYQWKGKNNQLAFSMKRGSGLINGKDGFIYKNVLATYTHIHALGTKIWAKAFVKKAIKYKNSRQRELLI